MAASWILAGTQSIAEIHRYVIHCNLQSRRVPSQLLRQAQFFSHAMSCRVGNSSRVQPGTGCVGRWTMPIHPFVCACDVKVVFDLCAIEPMGCAAESVYTVMGLQHGFRDTIPASHEHLPSPWEMRRLFPKNICSG
ncbi:hypothetical protein RB4111 [Rhodopirellula baltica SH 1]|uniref:Uncharacterized protein n=1 Tax=Rhodopirellula baltica (strain DSM 10527 / NCIMB 13988 / SH1) TaxID=243090 RepID=Q7UT48_RHOBA|nr:hypothetical protein RB4111 [Rhodopirellula baltica SH 1]